MNNGIPHDFSHQEYASDLTGCAFYFDSYKENTNRINANIAGRCVLSFLLKEKNNLVDVYVTIPENFNCIHYKKGRITKKYLSKDAHLTYHGKARKKKITGEIHIKSSGKNIFKGESDKTEAPKASSRNIKIYPLPICRIELSDTVGNVTPKNDIGNYFELKTEKYFFNTIEVHLAKRGYLKDLASVSRKIPDEYSALFLQTSMHTFYLDKIERRPGLFPQALAMQIDDFELIILATHEYKNPSYSCNAIRYFYTKDYFRELGSRNIIKHGDFFFVDQKSNMPQKDGAYRLLSRISE